MDAVADYTRTLAQYPGSALLATALGAHGYRKGSLSTSGAIAAAVLGFLCLASPLRTFGVALLVFYFTGSRLTKYKVLRTSRLGLTPLKADLKAGFEEERSHSAAEGQRTAIQVGCNALLGTVAAIAYTAQPRSDNPFEDGRFWLVLGVAFWAGCMGDTAASELGILSKSPPVLLTTLRQVPPGTNGGVTPFGLAVSLLGGLFIGIAASISLAIQTTASTSDLLILIVWSGFAGLVNSMFDSVLGAHLQQTLYDDETHKIVLEPTVTSRVISGHRILSNNAVRRARDHLTPRSMRSLVRPLPSSWLSSLNHQQDPLLYRPS